MSYVFSLFCCLFSLTIHSPKKITTKGILYLMIMIILIYFYRHQVLVYKQLRKMRGGIHFVCITKRLPKKNSIQEAAKIKGTLCIVRTQTN